MMMEEKMREMGEVVGWDVATQKRANLTPSLAAAAGRSMGAICYNSSRRI